MKHTLENSFLPGCNYVFVAVLLPAVIHQHAPQTYSVSTACLIANGSKRHNMLEFSLGWKKSREVSQTTILQKSLSYVSVK